MKFKGPFHNINKNWETNMNKASEWSRRDALKFALAASASATMLGRSASAAGGTVNFADIGVGDPGGDWSRYTATSGYDVNLVSIGNAPSAILNVLIVGGGTGTYDIINIVGGMQKPLVDNDLIEELDTSRMPNWDKNKNIGEFLGKGTPGFQFIGYNDKIYGCPTVLQGDSFAYLPEKTGPLDSYGAMFDPQFKGYVALEDNYTTAAQKTALYLKHSGKAAIANPDDMTPDEFRTVIDFLIEQKKAGQFRVIWSSFQQAVDLGCQLAFPGAAVCQEIIHFLVCESLLAHDRDSCHFRRHPRAIGGEFDESRLGVAHTIGLETGQAVGDHFRQHR